MESYGKDIVLCFRANKIVAKKLDELVEEYGENRSAIIRVAISVLYDVIRGKYQNNQWKNCFEKTSAEQK